VNTWKDSWFEEDGLRVLYILPRAWTDQTLPITMNPAPRELVRVMVGRAEIIPPDQQERIRDAITRAADAESDAVASNEAKEEFRKLGRFAEPALSLALRQAPQPVNQKGWKLMYEAAEAEKVKAQAPRVQPIRAASVQMPVAPVQQAQVQLQVEARAW